MSDLEVKFIDTERKLRVVRGWEKQGIHGY